ncbi:TIGR01777 family oxidoreductase [Flagellimonas sp. CMM7]|uniref:TIGR01777 family oxidoreductase n=1 Tax=Flagellimonas sp. CMM7 TaxID=2654676 RepID=UPI0013D79C6F|nr:TIGR01777 family oxidoreductase [Flagellimonas sp. CMM7]UII78834.1 TIGR01777 family oxidoreductase [Flagellimonas sp. CMM7]
MKVLITGATGLVGKAIVKVLHEKGMSVNYLTTRREKIISSQDFNGFYWNPSKNEIDLACFDGVSAIINLAGAGVAKRWSPSYKKKILSSRVTSLQTLHKALGKIDSTQVKSLVSASAIGIYPNSLINFYDENETGIDDSFLGEVVEKWEREVDTFNSFNFSVSKIRIGIVLSIMGGALPKMARPIQNFVGAAFGTGNQWQSWIHIEDLAQIFVFAIENNLNGAFNAVAPNPVTNAKMTKELARILDKPLILPNVPRLAMKIILGEMSYILFASQRVSCKRIEEKGFVFRHTNIGAALENLYLPKKEASESQMTSMNKEFV